jgi:hypothetical protein
MRLALYIDLFKFNILPFVGIRLGAVGGGRGAVFRYTGKYHFLKKHFFGFAKVQAPKKRKTGGKTR